MVTMRTIYHSGASPAKSKPLYVGSTLGHFSSQSPAHLEPIGLPFNSRYDTSTLWPLLFHFSRSLALLEPRATSGQTPG